MGLHKRTQGHMAEQVPLDSEFQRRKASLRRGNLMSRDGGPHFHQDQRFLGRFSAHKGHFGQVRV